MLRATSQAFARPSKWLLATSKLQHQSKNFKSAAVVPLTNPDILYTGVSFENNF